MMKQLKEEDIKRLLEEQREEDRRLGSPSDENDEALYTLLFTALADEPTTLPNIDLAEAVVKQIKINEQKAESFRYNLAIAAVLIGGVLSVYFAISYISPANLKSALNFIDAYKWIFMFIIFCFALIEIADKTLIKRNLLSN